MASLPQFTWSGDSGGQPNRVGMDPGAAAAPWAALGRVGNEIQQTGALALQAYRVSKQAEKEKIQDEAHVHVSEKLAELQNEMSQFVSDPENSGRTDLADLVERQFTTRLDQMVGGAPSDVAANGLRANGAAILTRGVIAARGKQNENFLSQIGDSMDRATQNAASAFRAQADNSPDYARQIHSELVQGQIATIRDRFGKSAPAFASALEEKVIEGSVLAVAAKDPSYAKDLLDSGVIDEKKRSILSAHIDALEQSGMSVERAITSDQLSDRLKSARETDSFVVRPDPSVWKVFGKEADKHRALWERSADAIDSAQRLFASMSDKNIEYQSAQAAKFLSNTDNADVADAVQRRLAKNSKIQKEDPARWVSETPEMKAKLEAVTALPDDDVADGLRGYYQDILKYQGYPPKGAGQEEAAKYLGRPELMRHVYSVDKATSEAASIRMSNLNDTMDRLEMFESRWKAVSPELAAVAMRDMEALPKEGERLDHNVKLAFLIDDRSARRDFLAKILQPQSEDRINHDKTVDFLSALQKNTTFDAFKSVYLFGGQGADLVDRTGQSIVTYAKGLINDKRASSPRNAVDAAVKTIIGDNKAFFRVNGNLVPISRKIDNTVITDDSAVAIGRRMTVALSKIDPRIIAEADVRGVPFFRSMPPGKRGEVDVEQYIRDAITSNGTFVERPDGKSYRLWMATGEGVPFEVRTKDGKALEIRLDSLPSYSQKVNVLGMPNYGVAERSVEVAEPVSKTYPLQRNRHYGLKEWLDDGALGPITEFFHPVKDAPVWPTTDPAWSLVDP